MSNLKTKSIKKAVILAGGLGTRFLPATLALAKELFPICENPILLYHLEDLIQAGISEVLIVGNKLKEDSFSSFLTPSKEYMSKIKEDNKLSYLEKYTDILSKLKITYINQELGTEEFKSANNISNEVRGSSIAILACKEWSGGEPFVVLNGDDFCKYNDNHSVIREMIDVFEFTNDYVILGREVDIENISKYSSMKLNKKLFSDKSYKIDDIIEKPKKEEAPSNIMGFAKYIFKGDVFDKIIKSKPRGNGEYCITDVLSDVAKSGNASTSIFTGNYYDCGSKQGLQMAGNYVLMQDKQTREYIINEIERLKSDYKV